MDKKIICITGPDGCGKSTLLKGISKRVHSLYVVTIWDLLKSKTQGLPFKSKKETDLFLCGLTPDSRSLFLAHAMKYAMDMALKSKAETILIDSYYYKYFVSELALGANRKLIFDVGNSFPDPDLTIYLDLDPQTAGERKKQFSGYECGLQELPDFNSFNTFQQKAFGQWSFFKKKSWKIIDANLNPEEVLAQAMKLIMELL